MEAARLYQLIETPSLLDAGTLADLSAIVRDYPCFLAARLLYLKNLAVLHDARFAAELQKTAAYVPDRRALNRLIEERGPSPKAGATQPAGKKEEPFALIDSFLKSLGEDAPPPAVCRAADRFRLSVWGGNGAGSKGRKRRHPPAPPSGADRFFPGKGSREKSRPPAGIGGRGKRSARRVERKRSPRR